MKSTGCLPDVLAPRSLPALPASALFEGSGASAEVCHCVGCGTDHAIGTCLQGRHATLRGLQRADRLSCRANMLYCWQ